MDQSKLTSELIEKVKACTTKEELVDLFESEGIELDDEQLAAVAGGMSQENLMDLLKLRACVM